MPTGAKSEYRNKKLSCSFIASCVTASLLALTSPLPLPVRAACTIVDRDLDSLPDALEQELAEKYAPVVYHEKYEKNFPWNVEDFIRKTSLYFYDEQCAVDRLPPQRPSCLKPPNVSGTSCLIEKSPLLDMGSVHGFRHYDHCRKETFYAHAWMDRDKRLTFYLSDVDPQFRKGDRDTRKWITYFHAYANDRSGITIQYWRFYPYNTGPVPGGLGSHGGDWEAIHVVLDREYNPAEVRMLRHRGISRYSRPQDRPWTPGERWGSLRWEGNHPKVRSENGGHASSPFTKDDESRFIRQETWTGGKVRWPAAQVTDNAASPLRNLGEKTRPLDGMWFIQYSGLWGSPGKSLLFVGPISSGYWGPAYNETARRKDEFVTAWCEGMKDAGREVVLEDGLRIRECYPPVVSE